MNNPVRLSNSRGSRISVLAALALCLQTPLANGQSLSNKQESKDLVEKRYIQPPSLEQRAQITYDSYILGPGDGLQIELLDLPELSGRFSIGPDGTLYLPRLRALYVEGLTVEELRDFLTQQYKKYVRNPILYLRPVVYRPVRIYVGGEVKRPGYYTLRGDTDLSRLSQAAESQQLQAGTATDTTRPGLGQLPGGASSGPSMSGLTTFGAIFPTVFDAIRNAQGITPYSNLAQVQVTRKRAQRLGGGRIRTKLNFLSLITEGDESQNIRLFDGDVVSVAKSNVVMREQLLKAGQTNLTPQFIRVFVTGRVTSPGAVSIPQGASLNEALMLAGVRFLKGKVEFIRFTKEGEIDRRVIRYAPGASSNATNNPLLSAGDLIRVQESAITTTVSVLNELASPAVGIYSVYSLLNGFQK